MREHGHFNPKTNKHLEGGGFAMRPKFRFSMADISPGTIISFKDNPTIIAEVYDDRHILFDGEKMSLSRATTIIRNVKSGGNGPRWWVYRGKTLTERRRDKERKDR